MGAQSKVGVYLYRGPEPTSMDPDWGRLAADLRGVPSGPVVYEISSRDLDAGLEELRAELRANPVRRVIVAGACPVGRVEPPLYKMLRGEALDPNRAQVVDLSPVPAATAADAGAALRRARVLIDMALARAAHPEPENTPAVPGHDAVLVVGGGIAGLTAAHELAAAGYRVVLVERSENLGGQVARLHRYYPRQCDPVCGVSYLEEDLRRNDLVTIETAAGVSGITGPPGRFEATVRRQNAAPGEVTYRVGAVINATGWENFDARRIKGYGYGNYPNVVTAMDLEQLATQARDRAGAIRRPADGQPVKRVAFIQCAGSRSARYLNYCSQICCTVTLKQLAYLRDSCPDAEITVFYTDLRVLGKYEDLYRRALAEGVRFVRGMPDRVEENPRTRNLVLRAVDTLSGRPQACTADLVVLATGMVPNRRLEWLPAPEGSDGLYNAHDVCFPGLTSRPGIFMAGACEEPMDVAQSVRSSLAAAMRSVRFLQRTVPAAGLVPVVDHTKCDRCGRCISECPTGAMRFPIDDGPPVSDPLACRHCGICQGGCPLQCVALPFYSFQGMANAIQAVDLGLLPPDPAILLFLCRHDAYPAYETAVAAGTLPPNVIPVRVPCAGIVNTAWVADALMHGFDGIAVAGCPRQECHAGPGFTLAQERLASAGETLERMMLEPGRTAALPVGINDAPRLVEELKTFVARLKQMGPSPFRI